MERILNMTKVPNIFSFATKELAQDATIAYNLDWVNPKYRKCYPSLHEMGVAMTQALLKTTFGDRGELAVLTIEKEQGKRIRRLINEVDPIRSIVVQTQYKHIDILVRINDESETGIILLIEDKVNTEEHST